MALVSLAVNGFYTIVLQPKAIVLNPETINILLHRPLKKGIEHDRLMPFSDCSSTLLANGDTKVAIDNMAKWSKEHVHHTELLANTLFKNLSLAQLCKELHSFLYHHFQYKIDGYEQKLRSPACSWSDRTQGIDCKSYSIFASTVLLNLGINHYLRRVIQNEGEGYSHVYVVVPKNQKTNNLNQGYFTIDGTLKITEEVQFYQKDDVYLSKKDRLGSVIGMELQQSAAKVIAVVTDLLIQGFLNEIMGCDDAAYELPIVQLKLQRDLQAPLTRKINNLVHAITINNSVRAEHIFNDIFKELDLGIAHLRNETAYSQRDSCIADTLSTALKYAEEIKKVFDIFYNNFKKTYTQFKFTEYIGSANVNQRTLYFVIENDSNTIVADYRFIKIEQDKSLYPIEPVLGFRENPKEWILENKTYLQNKYRDNRHQEYGKEVQPILDKVVALRAKFHIGGEMLYYLEQPLQNEMNAVWLKYDDEYSKFIRQIELENLQANQKSLQEYQARFLEEVAANKRAKKRKKDKIQLGVGIAIAALLIAINTEKEE
ncbi:hypothetical protein [Tenacibaculum sp. 190130A14a]|uniref:Transglutaminase superfamily protein n=1 Tax=Tenacibaculum polynesiense TaxID=3137857 RepID=A0ABM9PG61_9FLAO